MATEAQRRAAKKYEQTSCRKYTLKLNVNNDADLICWLDSSDNIQGLIKDILNKYLTQITRR